ncbi:unnamed protein product [Pleuronectes platessa]|uniref:Uncharacterized protein n=1 Tax=Pleuronectes platessa TaxID=8262 RepID=A0A9N7V0B3_PLEPL|nr:unnamed protein product [Pleuronectes platessa]
MEHIRTEHGEEQPYFYFPWPGPKWKKKGLEPALEEEQRSFLWPPNPENVISIKRGHIEIRNSDGMFHVRAADTSMLEKLQGATLPFWGQQSVLRLVIFKSFSPMVNDVLKTQSSRGRGGEGGGRGGRRRHKGETKGKWEEGEESSPGPSVDVHADQAERPNRV